MFIRNLALHVLLACSVLLPAAAQVRRAARPARPAPPSDEQVLKEAKIATDAASLYRFLDKDAPKGGTPAEIKSLIAKLGSDDFAVREQASRDLVAVGWDAFNYLRDAQKNRDPEVAKRATSCLEEIFRIRPLVPAAVRLLLRAQPEQACRTLLKSKKAPLRLACLSALGKRPPRVLVPTLMAALDDEDAFVRQRVREALWGVIGPQELPELLRLAGKAPSRVRVGALYLLGQYKSQPTRVVPTLLKAAEDKDQKVRWMAVHSLGEFPRAEGVLPALITALHDKDSGKANDEYDVGRCAAATLARLASYSKPAVPALIQIVKGERIGHKDTAINALGLIGSRDHSTARLIVPTLVGVLEDSSASNLTRTLAARALGLVGPEAKAAIPALKQAKAHANSYLSTTAAKALQQINR